MKRIALMTGLVALSFSADLVGKVEAGVFKTNGSSATSMERLNKPKWN